MNFEGNEENQVEPKDSSEDGSNQFVEKNATSFQDAVTKGNIELIKFLLANTQTDPSEHDNQGNFQFKPTTLTLLNSNTRGCTQWSL